jgi:S1 RNA binding family protein
VGLGHKQLTEDPWLYAIPDAYRPGMVVHGKVTKITNFGVFVELEEGLEGLLHISELADHKVDNLQDIVRAWGVAPLLRAHLGHGKTQAGQEVAIRLAMRPCSKPAGPIMTSTPRTSSQRPISPASKTSPPAWGSVETTSAPPTRRGRNQRRNLCCKVLIRP